MLTTLKLEMLLSHAYYCEMWKRRLAMLTTVKLETLLSHAYCSETGNAA